MPEAVDQVDQVLRKLEAAAQKVQDAPPEPIAPPKPVEKEQGCPRCGWLAGITEKPLQSDIDNYVRSIFGAKFSKTFELYNGSLKLTFTMPAAEDADNLQRFISKLPKDLTDYEVRELDVKIRLMATLTRIEVVGQQALDFEPLAPSGTQKDILEAFTKRFKQASGGAMSQLARSLELFNILIATILTHGFDPNFWKGAKST